MYWGWGKALLKEKKKKKKHARLIRIKNREDSSDDLVLSPHN